MDKNTILPKNFAPWFKIAEPVLIPIFEENKDVLKEIEIENLEDFALETFLEMIAES